MANDTEEAWTRLDTLASWKQANQHKLQVVECHHKTVSASYRSTSPAHHQALTAKAPVTQYLAPARHTGCIAFRTVAQLHPAATGTSTLARPQSILEMDSPPLRLHTKATISTG